MTDREKELRDEQESSRIADAEDLAPPSKTGQVLYRFVRHKVGMVGLIVTLLLVLMAIFAPLLAPYDPNEVNLRLLNRPPSREYLLGTDDVGRDILSRTIFGARPSLAVGVAAVGIYCAIGMVLGSLAGYFGGTVDTLISRFTEVIMCFPTFMLIMTVATALSPSIFNVMIIIGMFGWTGVTRLVRGQFLSIRAKDFVMAARAVGVRDRRIVFSHILPNAISPVIVSATLGLAGAIRTEAGLSFLGLGVRHPNPSWGNMVSSATSTQVLQFMPWRWVPPAVMIAAATVAINFLGEGVRDAIEPRKK